MFACNDAAKLKLNKDLKQQVWTRLHDIHSDLITLRIFMVGQLQLNCNGVVINISNILELLKISLSKTTLRFIADDRYLNNFKEVSISLLCMSYSNYKYINILYATQRKYFFIYITSFGVRHCSNKQSDHPKQLIHQTRLTMKHLLLIGFVYFFNYPFVYCQNRRGSGYCMPPDR